MRSYVKLEVGLLFETFGTELAGVGPFHVVERHVGRVVRRRVDGASWPTGTLGGFETEGNE